MKQPFEHLVAEHGEAVLRVCRAVLGPGADAEDAWSETFLAALRAYPQLRDQRNLRGWLLTIAYRKSVDVLRGRTRMVPVAEPAEQVSTSGVPDSAPLSLWEAVAALPDKQRQAIAYHHLAGLPYDEVAELTGGTAAAARRAAADGIRKLRIAYTREDLT